MFDSSMVSNCVKVAQISKLVFGKKFSEFLCLDKDMVSSDDLLKTPSYVIPRNSIFIKIKN